MTQRVQLQPAYILSCRPYRETSSLVEAFTEPHGRVGLVARGSRSSKRSSMAATLQCFRRCLLSWTERGDLATLTAAEPDGPPVPLAGEAIFSGWYVNELLLRLLARHDPHPELFAAYESALAAFAGAAGEEALRLFEKRLLGELGYGVHLPPGLSETQWYEYDGDEGFRSCASTVPGALAGASLLGLARDELRTPAALRDARRLLRAALARQLGDRELETPKLLRALRRGAGAREPGSEDR